MCIPATIPSGWQQTCLKKSGRVAPDCAECSLFCSPNGKTFKTLDEVHSYNCKLEREKLEKEEFLGKNIYSFHQTGNSYQFVQTSSQAKNRQQSFNNNRSDETVSCLQCKLQFSSPQERLAHMNLHSKSFQNVSSVNEHLKRAQTGPPGPPIQRKVASSLDLRLQNFGLNSNTTSKNTFNEVFQRKEKTVNLEEDISGLSVNVKSTFNNSRSLSSEEARAELRRRYIDACESVEKEKNVKKENVEKEKKQRSGPPGPSLVSPVEVRNIPNTVPVTQPFSIPGPVLQRKVTPKIPISGMEMLRAMEEQEAKKKKVRQSQLRSAQQQSLSPVQPIQTKTSFMISKTLNSPLRKVKNGKIAKNKDLKVPRAGVQIAKNSLTKFKISVNQICRFFNMVDYPLPITDRMRNMFQDFSKFERFYAPLLASVNPVSDPLKIKTLCSAKWREAIMAAAAPEQSSLYYNKPRKHFITVNTYG